MNEALKKALEDLEASLNVLEHVEKISHIIQTREMVCKSAEKVVKEFQLYRQNNMGSFDGK